MDSITTDIDSFLLIRNTAENYVFNFKYELLKCPFNTLNLDS